MREWAALWTASDACGKVWQGVGVQRAAVSFPSEASKRQLCGGLRQSFPAQMSCKEGVCVMVAEASPRQPL